LPIPRCQRKGYLGVVATAAAAAVVVVVF